MLRYQPLSWSLSVAEQVVYTPWAFLARSPARLPPGFHLSFPLSPFPLDLFEQLKLLQNKGMVEIAVPLLLT